MRSSSSEVSTYRLMFRFQSFRSISASGTTRAYFSTSAQAWNVPAMCSMSSSRRRFWLLPSSNSPDASMNSTLPFRAAGLSRFSTRMDAGMPVP